MPSQSADFLVVEPGLSQKFALVILNIKCRMVELILPATVKIFFVDAGILEWVSFSG